MKVCVVRNGQVETNASMNRIIDALISSKNEPIILSRSRYENKGLIKKEYKINDEILENYEIQIATEVGRGISGIFQLLKYQKYIFFWLIKNRKKYECIHSFDLDAGLPSIIVSKILNKKIVYHIADFYIDSRGSIPSKLKKVIKKIEYSIINNADATIICTEERKKQIEGSNPKKLTVIHNVPNINLDIVNMNIQNKDQRNTKFTYVGGLSKSRFINQILEIFKRNPEFTLEIAGMGTLSGKVEEYAKQYRNIIYHGQVSYKKALNLYKKTDIMFAMYDPKVANHKFAAPNKIYESMAMGKPIIVAKQTGLSDLVKEKEMGWTIDYDEKVFEKLILNLENNLDSVKTKGENAKKVHKDFSWSKVKKNIIDLYDEIEKI